MTNKPIQKFKLRSVQGAIFENQLEYFDKDGVVVTRTVQNIDICRSYRDKDGNWNETNSYSFEQLLLLRELIDDAIDYWKPQFARGQQTTDDAAEEMNEAA